MPTILLAALGAFLVGGAISLYRQETPRIGWIVCAVLALAAFVAAWAVTFR